MTTAESNPGGNLNHYLALAPNCLVLETARRNDAWQCQWRPIGACWELKSRQLVSLPAQVQSVIVQELSESRGGRPNEPYGFHGGKAILNHAHALVSACP